MGTPRPPCGLYHVGGRLRVLENDSRADRTEQFESGAAQCLRFCDEYGAWAAVLKRRSPSCGVDATYIDGEVRPGAGVTAALLRQSDFLLLNSLE